MLFGSVLMYIFGVIGSHPEVMDGTWVYDNYMSFEFDGKKNGYMHVGDLEYDYSYKVRGNKLKLDFTDDGYTTLCGDDGYMQCHSHPSVVQCFPANSYFLDSKQRDKLLNGYHELVK